MATGDAAAAAGLTVFASTQDIRLGYNNDNIRGDELAAHLTAGTHPASAINSGTLATARIPSLDASKITTGTFTSSQIPSLDASKITTGTLATGRIPNLDGSKITTGAISNLNSLSTDISAGTGYVTTNILNIKNSAGTNTAQIAGSTGAASFKNTVINGTLNVTSAAAVAGALYSAATYNQTNTGRAVYVAADGLMGVGSSSKRYKKNIKDAELDTQAVLAISVKTFQYKTAIESDDNTHLGVIAEDLHDLGLTDFVYYDEQNRPDGVAYDRLALALIPLIQQQEARLRAIEERLA